MGTSHGLIFFVASYGIRIPLCPRLSLRSATGRCCLPATSRTTFWFLNPFSRLSSSARSVFLTHRKKGCQEIPADLPGWTPLIRPARTVCDFPRWSADR